MNDLLEMLLGQQNKSNVQDIMGQFGLDEGQVKDAIGSLLPNVAEGIQKQAQQSNPSILDQIAQSQQQRYLDDEDARVYQPEALDEGNGILGQIFGSKDVSREVASRAAQDSGLDSDLLKKLLPIVASMAMGAVGKQAQHQGLQQNQGGLIDMVSSMIGNGQGRSDGFGLDDVVSIARKFLRS